MSIADIFFIEGDSKFSALRAFRLFRIFKIFRVGNLRVLLDSIAMSIKSIGNYVILLLLFFYVYALLGMQFFAGALKFDENGNVDNKNGSSPRENFDNIGWSFLTIFKLLIGDNWNVVMYNCMRANGPLSSLYFISFIICGNIIMLNLFLAVILSNFDGAREYMEKKRMFSEFQKWHKHGLNTTEMLHYVFGKTAEKIIEHTGIG